MKKDELQRINFQAILDGIDDGIFISNDEGTIMMVNKSVEKTGNKRMEELIGRNIDDLLEEGYCSEFVTKKVLRTGKKSTIIQKLSDGREFIVTGIPYYENGQIEMVVACERDVTELVQLQEKLSKTEELKSQYKAELEQLKMNTPKLENAVCESDCMKKTVMLAQKLAKIDSTVLIQGESGAGKEVIADHIYRNSARNGKPYIKVNCGAIPGNLLESEMFGYDPGAFTGALKAGKPGYFEMADGGTIFLDEVGELPLDLQVKLLRVIQDRRLIRVGGTETIPFDVRIIAATNRRLKDMVKDGKFRQDLFYRLSVTTINVPPLRERRADIIALSKGFMDGYNRKYGLRKKLSAKALKTLINYDWPGNVRELENLLESLIITSEGAAICRNDVEEYLFDEGEGDLGQEVLSSGSLAGRVEAFEKKILQDLYHKLENTGLMAKELETTKSTINRKLKRYQIR